MQIKGFKPWNAFAKQLSIRKKILTKVFDEDTRTLWIMTTNMNSTAKII